MASQPRWSHGTDEPQRTSGSGGELEVRLAATPEDLAQTTGIVRNISFSGIRATVVKPFPLPESEWTSNYNPGEVFSCIGLNAVGTGFLENISFESR